MKKKLFLPFMMIPFLSSCALFPIKPFSWDNYLNDSFAMNLQSTKFEKYVPIALSVEIPDLKAKIGNAILNGNVKDFDKYYNSLYNYFVQVIDAYTITSTKYYSNSNEDMYDISMKYYDQYNELRIYFIGLEKSIYEKGNEEIRKDYFGDMTNEEILERLEENEDREIQAEYDAYFKDLTDAGQVLYNDFRTGQIDLQTYYIDGFDIFLDYINTANELIEKVDYENYLEYSYENDFDRDYTYEDALSFVSYVKQYLAPILVAKTDIDQPRDLNQNLFNTLTSYNFCNNGADSAKMFSKYAKDLGGQYLTAYNNAWKYGYYCFSDSEDSLATAFEWNLGSTNDAILYFSKNYQNILSVVHEFGHYYGTTSNDGEHVNDCLDLNETYSQGDEYTFLNFLLEEKKDSPDFKTYQFFADYQVYDNLFYIVQQAVITEIECFAYTEEDLTLDSLVLGVSDILDSYNGAASATYFMSPCICSPCYYISYSTSLVEALQFLSVDYSDAKKMYTNLIENQSGSTTIEKWKSAGLPSPFEEDSIKNLATLFTEIKNRY